MIEDKLALELDYVRSEVAAHPEYLEHSWVTEAYMRHGVTVESGRWNSHATRIIKALSECLPLSMIRIGDGEVHLLSHDDRTPHLDRYLLQRVVDTHLDRFRMSDEWASTLRNLMRQSIASADVVGVRGIDADPHRDVSSLLSAIDRDIRGGVGMFRSIHAMLGLARQGFLSGKVVASAHLYFGILQRLSDLIEPARAVVCITSRGSVAAAIAKRYSKRVEFIETGQSRGGVEPRFLDRIKQRLPTDLEGCLCLVGAGVWAEFYCHWAKELGGVAVDIGSGFDLLAGEQTRPIHKRLLGEAARAQLSILEPPGPMPLG